MPGPVNITGQPQLHASFESRPGSKIAYRALGPKPAGVQLSFSDFLSAQVSEVNFLQQEADTAVTAMATGRSNNLHETMIALDRADVSFRLLTKVRSKAIDAYREIMQMHI
jgi:flagellar hook-basal body complex protein FliE